MFFLGQIEEAYRHNDTAKYYYQRAIAFSEAIKDYEAGYYIFSLLKLGRLYQKEGNKRKARFYYEKVKKRTKRKHSAHEMAREYLKEL
ncbi:MAG: hypothetical protein HC842_07280 [Cytophagales bacterium]|nr:hypothetical protein [Cytophagales bacterium]